MQFSLQEIEFAVLDAKKELSKSGVDPSNLDAVASTLATMKLLSMSKGVAPIPPVQAQPQDLVSFFLDKSPKGQYQQVAVITYYYQKCRGGEPLEFLTYKEYEEAYATLRRGAVTMPTDVGGSVRNTLNRTDYLFSPSKGKFAITIPGERFVESLPADS